MKLIVLASLCHLVHEEYFIVLGGFFFTFHILLAMREGASSLSPEVFTHSFPQPLQAWTLGVLGLTGHTGHVPIISGALARSSGGLVDRGGLFGEGAGVGGRNTSRPPVVKDRTSTTSSARAFSGKAARLLAILVSAAANNLLALSVLNLLLLQF